MPLLPAAAMAAISGPGQGAGVNGQLVHEAVEGLGPVVAAAVADGDAGAERRVEVLVGREGGVIGGDANAVEVEAQGVGGDGDDVGAVGNHRDVGERLVEDRGDVPPAAIGAAAELDRGCWWSARPRPGCRCGHRRCGSGGRSGSRSVDRLEGQPVRIAQTAAVERLGVTAEEDLLRAAVGRVVSLVASSGLIQPSMVNALVNWSCGGSPSSILLPGSSTSSGQMSGIMRRRRLGLAIEEEALARRRIRARRWWRRRGRRRCCR